MATTVGEIEVAIIARLDKLESDLNKAKKKTKETSDDMDSSLKKVQNRFGSLSKRGVASLGALAAGFIGLRKVMTDLVTNSAQADAAFVTLKASVSQAGLEVEGTTSRIMAMTEALDRQSIASQTQLVNASSYLINMGAQEDQIEDTLKAVLNLSAGLNMEFSTALRNVGRTFGGFQGELGELVPAIKTLDMAALEAGGAVEIVLSLFGGQMEAAMTTFDGKVKELSDSWDDYTAGVGSVITKNEEVMGSLKRLTEFLRNEDNQVAGAKFLSMTLQTLDFNATALQKISGGMANKIVQVQSMFDSGLDFIEDPSMRARRLFDARSEDVSEAIRQRREKNKEEREEYEQGVEELRALGMLADSPAPPLIVKKQQRFTAQQLNARKTFLQKLEDQYLKHKGNLTKISEVQMQRELAILNELAFENEEQKNEAELKIRENHSERLIQISRDAEAERADEELALLDKQIEKLKEQEEAWKDLFDYIGDGFKDTLADMIITGEASFAQLGESFLREFVQRTIGVGVDSIFDSIGSVFNAAKGIGNIDGLTSFGASEGNITDAMILDRVTPQNISQSYLSPGGRRSEPSGVSVNVINASGEKAETSETQNADGTRQIEVMIGKSVSADIYRGGPIDTAIKNAYGLKRPGTHGV
jgi:hypothetical protein